MISRYISSFAWTVSVFICVHLWFEVFFGLRLTRNSGVLEPSEPRALLPLPMAQRLDWAEPRRVDRGGDAPRAGTPAPAGGPAPPPPRLHRRVHRVRGAEPGTDACEHGN